MNVYSIGFTQKSARQFFERLKAAKIRRVVDVRISNSSQLAGFSKKGDLEYFLEQLCQAEYVHEPRLAPNIELLHDYRKHRVSWQEYETRFLRLMAQRKVEQEISPELLDGPTALLCTEPTPEQCHRRLVIEYLAQRWGNLAHIPL
ncbi:MAG TPA: DUF488 domain-containing protein [Chloroflexota bacterium]|nr:DUF488 domain-containing protein [Chloroflexota bacterium]